MIKNYSPKGTNSTPFNPQLQHFDMICGQVMNENRILKTISIALGIFSAVLAIGIILFEIHRPAAIPVLVTMNDFGETQYIGEVSKKNYQNFKVPEIAIAYSVKDFISCYHSLSTDQAIVKKNISKAYHYLTSTSAQKLSTLYRENNPYTDFGTFTREVEYETEPMKISSDSYQLDYKVKVRTKAGTLHETNRYRAVMTVDMLEPAQEDVLDNPLGIYITNFEIKPLR